METEVFSTSKMEVICDEFVMKQKKHIRILEAIKVSIHNDVIKEKCNGLIKKINELILVYNYKYN